MQLWMTVFAMLSIFSSGDKGSPPAGRSALTEEDCDAVWAINFKGQAPLATVCYQWLVPPDAQDYPEYLVVGTALLRVGLLGNYFDLRNEWPREQRNQLHEDTLSAARTLPPFETMPPSLPGEPFRATLFWHDSNRLTRIRSLEEWDLLQQASHAEKNSSLQGVAVNATNPV